MATCFQPTLANDQTEDSDLEIPIPTLPDDLDQSDLIKFREDKAPDLVSKI